LTFLNILFIINRYTVCFGYIPIIYFTFHAPTDTAICAAYIRYPPILSIVTQTIITIIVALRCYALYNRNPRVLIFVAVLGLAVLASFVWATTTFVGIDLNFGGFFKTCVPALADGKNAPYKVAWSLSIVFDSVVFGLTLYRTIQMMRVHRIRGTYGSLANLIMRDGSVYFIVMALSYIIHMILFFKIENSFFADSTGNNAIMTHTISVTMMSRLILNLNSYGERHTRRQSRSSLRPNPAVGLQPSTQFSTHVTNYSSWIARTAREFETEFESEASTGLTFSAGSAPTDDVLLTDDEYGSHDVTNDIEMTVRSRPRRSEDPGDGEPTRDSGSGWWWSLDERNA